MSPAQTLPRKGGGRPTDIRRDMGIVGQNWSVAVAAMVDNIREEEAILRHFGRARLARGPDRFARLLRQELERLRQLVVDMVLVVDRLFRAGGADGGEAVHDRLAEIAALLVEADADLDVA